MRKTANCFLDLKNRLCDRVLRDFIYNFYNVMAGITTTLPCCLIITDMTDTTVFGRNSCIAMIIETPGKQVLHNDLYRKLRCSSPIVIIELLIVI